MGGETRIQIAMFHRWLTNVHTTNRLQRSTLQRFRFVDRSVCETILEILHNVMSYTCYFLVHLCYSPMNSQKYITISRRFIIRSLLSKIFCTYSLIDQKKYILEQKALQPRYFVDEYFFSSASRTSNFALVWNFGSLLRRTFLGKADNG